MNTKIDNPPHDVVIMSPHINMGGMFTNALKRKIQGVFIPSHKEWDYGYGNRVYYDLSGNTVTILFRGGDDL